MNRRDFLTTTMTGFAGVASASFLHIPSWAQEPSPASATATVLKAGTRSLDINGKAASVYGLMQSDGAHGLTMNAGDSFDVALHNELPDPTLIHWHGLLPPWPMDGVPDTPAPLLKSGETRGYQFPVADAGTYWMHAHTLQEQNLLAAPLIVRSAGDAKADEQEVVILLHDFSFMPAAELLAHLKNAGGGMKMGGMTMGGMDQGMMKTHMAHMDHMGQMMAAMKPGGGMAGMGAMDLNDIAYDAYLANDRSLADPQVVSVEKSGRVRLRVINGATATAFTNRYRSAQRRTDRRRRPGHRSRQRRVVPHCDGTAAGYSLGAPQGWRGFPCPGPSRRRERPGRNHPRDAFCANREDRCCWRPQRSDYRSWP